MAVYKEINRADGSGVTTFYRISDILDTAETDDKESQSVVIDYNQAQNKPSINGVALVGNKTSEDLGLQPAGDYITNNEADEKFIDEDELEAKNYVNQTELQDAIAHIEHFHREIVEALPVTGMDNVLYMVRKGGTGEDIYNEYIWVGLSNSENGYEFLGTTATDLTDYYKKSQVDAALATKVDKEGGKGLSEENYTLAEKTKLAGLKNYDDTEIQAEVSGLNTDINNLKKSNVTISNTLAELKPDVESNTAAVSTIYDLLDNKMTAIRLVEQGDGWVWMNLEGSRLTYAQASAALGHENCMLFIEQLENDGKVIPAEYKSEGDHINIIFKDLDCLVHVMTCGEDDVVVTKDVTTTNGQVNFTVEDEAIGYTTKMTALYGKSTQATRSGKNLFNKNATGTLIGVNKTVLDTGVRLTLTSSSNYRYISINIGGSELLGKTLTFGGVISPSSQNSGSIALYFGSSSNTAIGFIANQSSGGSKTITIPNEFPSGANEVHILLYGKTTGEGNIGDYVDYTDLMVVIGNSLGGYEDYGVMPSPDYPSEIKTITGNIKVTSHGKNLLPNNAMSKTSNGVTFTKNSDGTVIANGTATANCFYNIISDNEVPITTTNLILSGCPLGGTGSSYRLRATYTDSSYSEDIGSGIKLKDGKVLQIVTIVITNGTTCNNLIFKPMVSSDGGEYESYQGLSLNMTIPENEFLGKIGDIKDTLNIVYKDDGHYHAILNKKIGKVVLDGSESW